MDVAVVVAGGLHDFVDHLQKRIADVHTGIEASWFAPAPAQLVRAQPLVYRRLPWGPR